MFVSYYLHKMLKLCVSQIKNRLSSCFLILLFILRSLFLALNSIIPRQGPPQGLKSSPYGAQCQILCYSEKKKGKLAEMTTRCHSLLFVVTHCHLLSFVVTRCGPRCYSMYHSSVFLQTIILSTHAVFKGRCCLT